MFLPSFRIDTPKKDLRKIAKGIAYSLLVVLVTCLSLIGMGEPIVWGVQGAFLVLNYFWYVKVLYK